MPRYFGIWSAICCIGLSSVINSQFQGVGICLLNLAEDMQQYVRALFIAMYVLPMVLIVYFNVKISRELKRQAMPAAILYAPSSRTGSGSQDIRFVDVTSPVPSDHIAPVIDVQRERRTQHYFTYIITIYAVCLCPLMVLRLAKMALTETYENSGHFDVVFALFVWLAFVPTCSTPCLLFFWFLSRVAKDRLKCCFRSNDRKFLEAPHLNVGGVPVSTPAVADVPAVSNSMVPLGVACTHHSAYPTVPATNAFSFTT